MYVYKSFDLNAVEAVVFGSRNKTFGFCGLIICSGALLTARKMQQDACPRASVIKLEKKTPCYTVLQYLFYRLVGKVLISLCVQTINNTPTAFTIFFLRYPPAYVSIYNSLKKSVRYSSKSTPK